MGNFKVLMLSRALQSIHYSFMKFIISIGEWRFTKDRSQKLDPFLFCVLGLSILFSDIFFGFLLFFINEYIIKEAFVSIDSYYGCDKTSICTVDRRVTANIRFRKVSGCN